MSTLMDEVSGLYLVHTESGSTYSIDLDRQELCRMSTPDDPARVHGLRRDGSTVTLLDVLECTVGRPMHLLIDLAVPGVLATTRRTTPVTGIERVTGVVESLARVGA
ncbi:hypothetical protein [Cryobacterium sp. CAN_C2]|uniref:hypothetical protein n=2 Tax=unclassified Cryobacterium TaxID=2649013 RepID=UPI0018CA27CC